MDDVEYAWVDIRTVRPGWKEAFRFRLTGWLPASWARSGLQHGVFKVEAEGHPAKLTLTEKGKDLTDPKSIEYSLETFEGLFRNITFHGFSGAWLTPPKNSEIYLASKDEVFSKDFVATLLSGRGVSRS